MYLLCVVLCYLFSGRNWIGRKGACVRVDFHCIQVKCFMLRICFKSSACPTRGRVSGSRSTTFCNPIFWPDSFAKKMWLLWGAYWRIFVSVVRYPPPHSPLYNILCGGPDRTPSPQKTNPPTHLFMAGIWIEKRSIVWGIHFVGMLPFKYHCHSTFQKNFYSEISKVVKFFRNTTAFHSVKFCWNLVYVYQPHSLLAHINRGVREPAQLESRKRLDVRRFNSIPGQNKLLESAQLNHRHNILD